jgi:N-glycosylase/DNA lyase
LEFTVSLGSPFSLDFTLESGQLFRWERKGEWWVGDVAGSVLKMRQEGDALRCESGSDSLDSSFVARYFRLDEDLDRVFASISKDRHVTEAVEKYYGLRIASQDPWECLGSFVLATNANIPRIKKMVAAICARYGRPFEFDGETHYAFPGPESLSAASVTDLRSCGLGYRAPFLRRVATSVSEGKLDFAGLEGLEYEEARKVLLLELFGKKVLLGVGPKVADCVLLYSCRKDEAFPIDVWIARVLASWYPRLLGPALGRRYKAEGKVRLSPGGYARISGKVRSHFGVYAGWAQQYLFVAAREGLA